MFTKPVENKENNRAKEITELLAKIERTEKIRKLARKEVSIPSSSPTQGTMEVKLPFSYGYFPRVE